MRNFCAKALALLLAALMMLLCVACNLVPAPQKRETDETSGTTTFLGTTNGGTTDDGVGTQTTVPGTQTTTVPGTQSTTPPVGEVTTPTVTSSTSGDDPDPIEPTVEMLPAQEVKVIGINVLCNADSVDQRAPGMIELLRSYNADSIGVQECRGKWEQHLESGLGDRYARVGVDCNGNHNATNFATYVYYLKDQYVPIDTGTFWMSKTPDIPSKYGSTVDMNRTCTWVILENIETGFRYVHMNLHIDHMDPDVNEIQCEMILQQIRRFEEMGYPVFSTGDYNMRETTDSYSVMTSQPSHVADARYIAEDTTEAITHPGNGANIDYCFVTKQYMEVKQFAIVDTHATGVQLSDHRGTFTHAYVKSLPKQDHTKTIPAFEDDAEIGAIGCPETMISFEFPQALDRIGSVARSYLVEIMDPNGLVLLSETVSSGYYTPSAPEVISYTKSLSDGSDSYLVRITPKSLLGQSGEALVQWVTPAPVAVDPEAPTATPDLLDLEVVGGAVKDQTANGYEITALGATTVDGETFGFSSNGNLKIADFVAHNGKLADGFAMALSFRTGADVSAGQTLVGNMHAGGYGIQIGEGRVSFSVFLNGAYVKAYATVQASTEYYVIGTFDPEIGVALYVNGQLADLQSVEDGEMSFATVDGAQYLCIGADSDASGMGEYFFKGVFCDVEIYSVPLTAGNALYLYQNR